MEYFLGSVICLATIFVVGHMSKKNAQPAPAQPMLTQSRSFKLLKPFIDIQMLLRNDNRPTQARRHFEDNTMRVVFMENKAYWIKNNALYVAEVIDGEVDESSAVQVDTMAMDKVQLDKTIFIVETLREGLSNDSGNTGYSQF